MEFVGLDKQIQRNNRKSFLLLLGFPLLILSGVYVFFLYMHQGSNVDAFDNFIVIMPFIAVGIAIWFLIAFSSHSTMINLATNSKTLERKENMRVYNLTENLCISVGMVMPKLRVINSDALNAFASGLNEKNFTVTLTTGIIETLDDNELEGVIAHELMHIRNKDVRLLIISIIFVGILSFAIGLLFRTLIYGGARRRSKNSKIDGRVILVALVIAAVVYLLTILFKFALSRKREYLADAGAAEMTRNPQALAGALRKISGNSDLEARTDDVKQMYIENGPKEGEAGLSSGISGLFATHPPILKRIEFLEGMK